MASHSSTLAWKIPWTDEPGRLQSMGSQRVGQDWATPLFFPYWWPSRWFDGLCWQHPQACLLVNFGPICYCIASLVAQTVKHLPATRETWVRSLGREDPLEEEMATHSNILAWEIPWTEESDSLWSMGLQRVRHNWATDHIHTPRT